MSVAVSVVESGCPYAIQPPVPNPPPTNSQAGNTNPNGNTIQNVEINQNGNNNQAVVNQRTAVTIADCVRRKVADELEKFLPSPETPAEVLWELTIQEGALSARIDTNAPASTQTNVGFHRLMALEDVPCLLRKAVEIEEQNTKPDHPQAKLDSHLACIKALTAVLLAEGKTREASEEAEKARNWAEKSSEARAKAPYKKHQARLVSAQDAAKAEQILDEILKDSGNVGSCEVCDARHQLADLYLKQGNFKEAEEQLKSILKAAEAVLGEEHPQTAQIAYDLACAYWNNHDLAQEEEMLRKALHSLAKHPGKLWNLAWQRYISLWVSCGYTKEEAETAAQKAAATGEAPGLTLPTGKTGAKQRASECAFDFRATLEMIPNGNGRLFQVTIDADRTGELATVDFDFELTLLFRPAKVQFVKVGAPRRIFSRFCKDKKTSILLDPLIWPDRLADETCTETIDVLIDDIRVGALELHLDFRAERVDVTCQFTPSRSAYACYAPQDRRQVIALLDRVQRVVPGFELVIKESLRHKRLRDLTADERNQVVKDIVKSNRLLLFWSARARASDLVEFEWGEALKKGSGSVDVVPLDDDVEPPQEGLRDAFTRALPRNRAVDPFLLPSPTVTGNLELFSASCSNRPAKLPGGDGSSFTLRVTLHPAGTKENSVPITEVALKLQESTRAIDEGFLSQCWTGGELEFDFELKCLEADGQGIGIDVFVEGIPVGTIAVTLDGPVPREKCPFHAREDIFACFAPDDRDRVWGRLQAVRRLLPDAQIWMVGDQNTPIHRTVDQADRLLLFWSEYANACPEVTKTWQAFIEQKNVHSIDIATLTICPLPPPLIVVLVRALPTPRRPRFTVACAAHCHLLRGDLPDITLILEESVRAMWRFVDWPPAEIALVFQPKYLKFRDETWKSPMPILWSGHRVEFPPLRLSCSSEVPDTVEETIRVFVAGVPIGLIILKFHFAGIPFGKPVDCNFRPFASAIALYAGEDRHDARGRLDAVWRVIPSFPITHQLIEFASKLGSAQISRTEKLILFWSYRSRKTFQKRLKEAKAPWDLVLRRQKRDDAIEIVRIGEVCPPKPPRLKELKAPWERSLVREKSRIPWIHRHWKKLIAGFLAILFAALLVWLAAKTAAEANRSEVAAGKAETAQVNAENFANNAEVAAMKAMQANEAAQQAKMAAEAAGRDAIAAQTAADDAAQKAAAAQAAAEDAAQRGAAAQTAAENAAQRGAAHKDAALEAAKQATAAKEEAHKARLEADQKAKEADKARKDADKAREDADKAREAAVKAKEEAVKAKEEAVKAAARKPGKSPGSRIAPIGAPDPNPRGSIREAFRDWCCRFWCR